MTKQLLCFFVVVLCFVGSARSRALDASRPVITQGLVDAINQRQNGSWQASLNSRFAKTSVEEAKGMMGFKPDPKVRAILNLKYKSERVQTIPTSFDSRKQWPGCVHPIRDQGNCGSCWAFGCTESLSDRFCIASNRSKNFVLSVQELVSCDLEGMEGCGGGDPVSAFIYTATSGLVLDPCVPYTSGTTGETGWCPWSCVNNQQWVPYYSQLSSIRWHDEVDSIQTAILTHGPVEACFEVYEDFMTYKSGVYSYTKGSALGGHCIKIIGWGVDSVSNKPYWTCANSWGVSWGMQGFFLIERGVNMCGIENEVYEAQPSL